MNAEERILTLDLPPPPVPAGLYERVLVVGNRCIVSGHGPLRRNERGVFNLVIGRVGEDLTMEEAKVAARLTGLTMLSSMRHSLGSLNRVKRLVRTFGLVNGIRTFERHPAVVDGFSELMKEVFGDRGVATRSAVGAGTLPSNIPVEIEAEFELHSDGPADQSSRRGPDSECRGNIYWERFGLTSVINCIGSFTSLGGSRMSVRVVRLFIAPFQ